MNPARAEPGLLTPIVLSTKVSLRVEAAFKLFTTEINRWWPLDTHSMGGKRVTQCVLEGQVGGRFYEVTEDGSQADWGRVLAWEPPDRIVFTLHPGRTPEYATEVEVTFQPEGESTRLTLIHRGWERCAELLGEAAELERKGYQGGWELILGRYAGAAGES